MLFIERWFLTYLILCLTIVSCTRNKDSNTKISFKLPEYTGVKQSAQSYKAQQSVSSMAVSTTGSKWGLSDPTSTSEIACYAVFVGGPGLDQKFCSDSSAGTEVIRFGREVGIFKPGEKIEINVPSGNGRTIYLIGFKTDDTSTFQYCYNIFNPMIDPPGDHLSAPRIVAKTVIDLVPGETVVNLNASLTDSVKFDDCSFFPQGPANGDGTTTDPGNPPQPLFGDGGDGDLNISTTNSNPSMNTYASLGNYTPGSRALSSTKIFSASARVIYINPIDGKSLQLGTGISDMHFQDGDEVLFYVTSGWHSTAPDSHACGGGLYRGYYKFAKVISYGTSSVVLDQPMIDLLSPVPINNGNLSAPPANATPFCNVMITRIPNFNILTISSSHVMSALGYDGANSPGLIAFRAKELHVNGAYLTVDTVGRGFRGLASVQGEGFSGPGSSLNDSNENGGGFGSSGSGGGGGGSGAGPGGTGGIAMSTTEGLGGTWINYCSGVCSIVDGHKIVFGGAGGSAAAMPGGNGGGAIFLHIGKIMGAGNLNIDASGAPGSGQTGSGAGGSVHLTSREVLASNIYINSNGFDGGYGGGSAGGGGGAGGQVEVRYCQSSSTNATMSSNAQVNGGLGGSGTPSGLSGSLGFKSILDEPTLCTQF